MKDKYFENAVPVWAENKEKEMNVTLDFCASAKKANRAIIKCAGASVYNIFINGVFVAAGPARAAHGFYRVDTIDISEKLKDGNNDIIIRVAGYNVNSFYTLDCRPFLCAEIICDDNICAATGCFGFDTYIFTQRIQKTQRYSYQRTFTEVYDTSKKSLPCKTKFAGERKYLQRNIFYPAYEQVNINKIIACGNVIKTDRAGRFKDRSLKNISESYKGFYENELEVVSTDVADKLDFCLENKETTFLKISEFESESFKIYDLGKNLTGILDFNIECDERTELIIVFDEIINDYNIDYERMETANVIIWRLDKGSHKLTCFEPYTLRYMRVVALGGSCRITNLKLIRFGYPEINTDKNYSPEIKAVYDAGVENFRQNTFDIFMDCPSRERAGWLCDSYFSGCAEYFLTGKNEVERNFLENYIIADDYPNIPSGMLPMCYPADFVSGGYIPAWAMWFILELEAYFKRSGDTKLLNAAKDKVYGLFKYFSKYENEYGLLENLDGWLFIEWSKTSEFMKDVNFPTNMLYAYVKIIAGKLYSDDALISSGKNLRKIICRMSYKDGFFCDNAVRENGELKALDNYTECCQYYAFFTETADTSQYSFLWEILVNEFGPKRKITGKRENVYPANAFIGNLLRLDLLSKNGLYEKCLEETKEYYGFMAEKTGTLWEHDKSYASCNHGFASYITCIIDKCSKKHT